MEVFTIEATKRTPAVHFNNTTGIFDVKGLCIPENPTEFFHTIRNSVTQYLEAPQPSTILNLDLEYLNTSSFKSIISLIELIKHVNTTQLTINWFHEADDEDNRELGEDLQVVIKHPVLFFTK